MAPVAAPSSDPALDDGVRPPTPTLQYYWLTNTARGSGILRSMRAPLGSERQWRNVPIQTDTSAEEIDGIDIAEKKLAFLCYPLLNIFAVAPQLTPPRNNPAKVYVESITVKAQIRASSAVQYRTMIVSGPTDGLTPSFNTCHESD